MFPFRRNGPKKRGKGGGGRRHQDHAGVGRRVPGSAAEILSMMQPSTKALAQMLAGNTKMSGQLVHARNVLAQANRMVEDRLHDRLPPAAREQFFEQLALLKLTISDAEEGLAPAETEPAPRTAPAPAMDAARLREGGLRLAPTAPAPSRYSVRELPAPPPSREEATAQEAIPARPEVVESEAPVDVAAAGPRRERLRLKPVQRPSSGSEA